LERRFACHDALKSWFRSYLTDKTHIYRVGSVSVPTRLICGVPSLDLLNPQHTPKTSRTISQCPNHLYADNTQILVKATLPSLEHAVVNFRHAYRPFNVPARRLQLNPDKTEFIFFGSAVRLQRLQTGFSTNIGSVDIKSVDCVRDLGVQFGQQTQHASPHQQDRLDLLFHLRRLHHLRRLSSAS